MRISNKLAAIFSPTAQRLLSAILLQRDQPWYPSDLARRFRLTPSTLQRPLEALVRAGVLRRWKDGNRVYFSTDPECPFLDELRGLLAKTIALADVLREILQPHSKQIQLAVIYGSVAARGERSSSDVDLLIVGSATLARLSSALAKAEKRLARPVNVTLLTAREFSDKLASQNHFLHAILDHEKIFVLGTAHDLEELAQPRTRRAARNKQGGTRRSAHQHRAQS